LQFFEKPCGTPVPGQLKRCRQFLVDRHSPQNQLPGSVTSASSLTVVEGAIAMNERSNETESTNDAPSGQPQATTPSKHYFLRRGDQIIGPLLGQQLKHVVATGQVSGECWVSTKAGGPWRRIADVPRLRVIMPRENQIDDPVGGPEKIRTATLAEKPQSSESQFSTVAERLERVGRPTVPPTKEPGFPGPQVTKNSPSQSDRPTIKSATITWIIANRFKIAIMGAILALYMLGMLIPIVRTMGWVGLCAGLAIAAYLVTTSKLLGQSLRETRFLPCAGMLVLLSVTVLAIAPRMNGEPISGEQSQTGREKMAATTGEMKPLEPGLPEDAAKSVEWYRKKAEQGHAEEQYAPVDVSDHSEQPVFDIHAKNDPKFEGLLPIEYYHSRELRRARVEASLKENRDETIRRSRIADIDYSFLGELSKDQKALVEEIQLMTEEIYFLRKLLPNNNWAIVLQHEEEVLETKLGLVKILGVFIQGMENGKAPSSADPYKVKMSHEMKSDN
jgi:hypothetical protein